MYKYILYTATLFDFLCRPHRPSVSPTQFQLTPSSNITNQPIENTNVVPIIHPRYVILKFIFKLL